MSGQFSIGATQADIRQSQEHCLHSWPFASYSHSARPFRQHCKQHGNWWIQGTSIHFTRSLSECRRSRFGHNPRRSVRPRLSPSSGLTVSAVQETKSHLISFSPVQKARLAKASSNCSIFLLASLYAFRCTGIFAY